MGNHPFCRMGKTTINRRFSIAMLNYRRVFGGQRRGQKRKMWLSNIVNQPNGDSLSPFSTTLPAPQFIGFGTCLHFKMLSSQWLLRDTKWPDVVRPCLLTIRNLDVTDLSSTKLEFQDGCLPKIVIYVYLEWWLELSKCGSDPKT